MRGWERLDGPKKIERVELGRLAHRAGKQSLTTRQIELLKEVISAPDNLVPPLWVYGVMQVIG